MLAPLIALAERIEDDRRWRILSLLAEKPRSETELRRHFRQGLTLRWNLRELHALGLVAYNRRADRYHLVRPAVEALAAFRGRPDWEDHLLKQAVPSA